MAATHDDRREADRLAKALLEPVVDPSVPVEPPPQLGSYVDGIASDLLEGTDEQAERNTRFARTVFGREEVKQDAEGLLPQ